MIKSELSLNRAYLRNVILTADLSLTSSEIIAYTTAILGMVGDQTSTRLGLMLPNVFESNPFVAFFLSRGLWLPFDLLVLSISIVLPIFLMRVTSFKGRSAILTLPLILGIIRILATVSNFLLFLSYWMRKNRLRALSSRRWSPMRWRSFNPKKVQEKDRRACTSHSRAIKQPSFKRACEWTKNSRLLTASTFFPITGRLALVLFEKWIKKAFLICFTD